MWWLAWAGLVPLLLVIRAAPTGTQGALRAWFGMAGFVLATQYWLWPSAGPLLLALAAGLGALWLPWGWAAHRMLSRDLNFRRLLGAVLVLPSAWVLAEAARSWDRLGGPWALMGASQWNQPATLASASLGGVYLVSFLVLAVNTAVAGAILMRSVRALALPVALIAVGPVWFSSQPVADSAATARVALVQPGDIADGATRQGASEKITETLAGQRLDLVVWAESSVAVDLATDVETTARLSSLSERVGADILVNVDARSASGGIYKTSVLIGPDGVRGTYAKTRLVPFGEFVPLRSLVGWATRHTEAATEDRRRGDGPVVLRTGALTIGPLISFEATFSDLPRREVELGADLLTYQSSTSSFQGSAAQSQLASMPAVHAVEVGRPAVHAGLSGISSAFDYRGRGLGWFPADSRGALVVEVPRTTQTTVYQRVGDWVVLVALLVFAGFTAWCARSARRSWTAGRR